jgi:uncharacterized membrane protein
MLPVIDEKHLLKVSAVAWSSWIMVPSTFIQWMLPLLQFLAVTVLAVFHVVFILLLEFDICLL